MNKKNMPKEIYSLRGSPMSPDDFIKVKQQFYSFTQPFEDKAEDPYPFVLKREHTDRVCTAMQMLCIALALDEQETARACAAAMVHDMGRFPQFARYHTYVDARSKNHAALSCGQIVRTGILSHLPDRDRRLILRAVALHNRPRVPDGLEPDLDLLARLLRDADKIDIYHVMKAHYLSRETGREFITHDLPDDGKVPKQVAQALLDTRENKYAGVNTLNAMKVFQAGMVYDLNFPATASAIRDMAVIPVLLAGIPVSNLMTRLKKDLLDHLDTLAASPVPSRPL